MSLLDRVIQNEAGGPDTGMYAILNGLLEGEPTITPNLAIAIARSIDYVLSHGDDPAIQNKVGTLYLRDLMVLAERSGRAWQAYQEDNNIGGQRS